MASRILVIDDDQSLLDLYRLLLEEEGHEVCLSLIAFEEVSDIEQVQPDLIILDAKLGSEHKGLFLLQKLKMYRPTQAIPVLLCTAGMDVTRPQPTSRRSKVGIERFGVVGPKQINITRRNQSCGTRDNGP